MSSPGRDASDAALVPELYARRESCDLLTPYVAPATPLERTLAEIWSAALRIDRVGRDDDLFELGLDSLSAAAAIVAIEERTGLILPMASLLEEATIRAIAAGLAGAEPPALPDLIVPFRTAGQRPPLFIVHGGGGFLWLRDAFLDALGPDQPIYGIRARGITGEAPPHETIAALAADYAAVLRQAHPAGPYLLAGVCIGGLIARHMAVELAAAGDAPQALLLVDPLAQDQRPRGLTGDAAGMGATDEGARYLAKLQNELRRLTERGLVAPADEAARLRLLQAQLDVRDGIERAVRDYEPPPCPLRAEFFVSDISYQRVQGQRRGGMRLVGPQDRVWRVAHTHLAMLGPESDRLGQVMRMVITEWLGGPPAGAAALARR